MNEIKEFSDRSEIHNMYEKLPYNYSNLAQRHIIFYRHEQHMVPATCMKYEQYGHISLQYRNKYSKFM